MRESHENFILSQLLSNARLAVGEVRKCDRSQANNRRLERAISACDQNCLCKQILIDYEALEGEKAQKVVINRPQMREVGSS